MKKILTILTIVALALFIVACAKPATPPTQTPPTTGGQEPTDQPAGKCIPKDCPTGQIQTDTNCECHVPPTTDDTKNTGDAPAKPDFDFGQDESNDLGSLGGK